MPLFAQDQKFAEIKNLRLEKVGEIASCRVGYRTFGTLNAAKSNGIVFPTWFGGKSADLAGSIGPGKLADSSRFFVIGVDALGDGVSCSPTNSSAAFPDIAIADMVESQYRLVTEHLGLRHLYAVMGISMGGMQTFQWMVAHPDFMDLAVPIVGSPRSTTTDLLLWESELRIIENAERCHCDLQQAMHAVETVHTLALYTPEWHATHEPADKLAALSQSIDAQADRGMRALDWAAQLKAIMTLDVGRPFSSGLAAAALAVKAKTLVVVSAQDHMVNPLPAETFARQIHAQTLVVNSDCGHMATGCAAAEIDARVRAFLEAE
ncbi:MAG: alpha/beta hydrolase [Bryobacteraceae bacterium]